MVGTMDYGTSTMPGTLTPYLDMAEILAIIRACDDSKEEPSFFYNEPGIYRPVIIPGATVLRDSLKDKIKAKYIRAGPRKQQ